MPGHDSVLRRIGTLDVTARAHVWELIPRELAPRLRPRVARVGDALLTLLETSDSLRLNRVVGLGHRHQASAAIVDRIIAWYRAAGCGRFSIELPAGPQAGAIGRWLGARGLKRRAGYVVLLRDLRTPIVRARTELHVRLARRGDLAVVTAIAHEAFAVPASRRAWSLASAAARGTRHFLACVGARPVAVGSLAIHGDMAWLGGGATRTPWRRRGAHGALIAARLRHAARHGCRWAWSETAAPRAGRPDGSRRNLLRHGFEEACVKPIFVWQER